MPTIRKASPKDAPVINVLVNSAYRGDSSRKGWTTEADLLDGTRTDAHAIIDLINRPDTIVLVYEEDDELIGCVELRKEESKLYLGMLSVKPEIQAKGIGKQLLSAAEEEAKRWKCDTIFMTVISVRAELIAWYVRHGYRDTGKRKPFIFDDPRFGQARQALEFMVLEKLL